MADNINPVLGNLAKDPKAVEDFSKDTEEVLARSDTMAKAGRLEEAVEDILALEKKTRQGYDAISTSKLICCICKLYFDANDWAKLREYIDKEARAAEAAITDMVHLAMGWLDGLGKDKKIELIQTLSEVTDGKIFVEVEKARLTKILAEMKEEEGDTDEAANLLQEVQVETFGAMDKMEKTTYILEQLRLVLLKKDYVRAQIISRKINPKLLEADDMQELKLRYNEYMVKFWLHEKKILDVSKCYLSMFNTKIVQEDEEKWKPALTAHDGNQETGEGSSFPDVVKIFIRQELATWPLADEKELKAHAVFQDQPHEGGAARWEMFRKRLNQHNIKVVSKYYDQIQTPRLCELLGLSDKETEEELSELVCGKFVHAKIDRPAGTIQKANYTDTLNNWGGSISKMLDLVENTCHLIQKEQMVHAARAKLKAKK
eukprot:CAMPEP_0169412810 /NCGR_PEP_ID=MMETSP1017-20121227/61019_1 /TAXON_ID=342587 /ORGANISM="Karlodinium micrum, Strain CCMP2283" /LENGTH=430 /DNA_ID=CAMNT_0009520179 /DNA_START=71 /DNA_END=1365 /DNA_ORIENTATION=+